MGLPRASQDSAIHILLVSAVFSPLEQSWKDIPHVHFTDRVIFAAYRCIELQ